jgi:hypothetical protein
MTYNITTLSIIKNATLSIITLSITTFSIMTLKSKNSTLGIKNTEHNDIRHYDT